MKSNILYKIENIECSYNSQQQAVLVVEELDILKGEVTFVIGSSGVGKSTFIESLGLMSNTINTANGVLNFEGEDILNIWEKGERELSRFRRNNFSFIFQNTNLFNNLTMIQNASITQVLRGRKIGQANGRSEKLIKEYLGDVFSDTIVDRSITQMSGGQRQRLAFVRAIATEFKVLFADEPTGNLDPGNANNLLSKLKSQLPDHQSIIIVSHDINLAIKYADKIVLINKEFHKDNTGYGLINKKSLFVKTNDCWLNDLNKIDIKNIFNHLSEKLNIQLKANES
jgi:ABC-type lipoprotein export system ATPase subunit